MGRIIHAGECSGASVFVEHLLQRVPVIRYGEAEHEEDVGKRAIFADFADNVQIKFGRISSRDKADWGSKMGRFGPDLQTTCK